MIRKTLATLLTIAISVICNAQSENDPLDAFRNLAGSTWISEGDQLGGHQGKTVKRMEWGLDSTIVKVKTYTTDPKTLTFGLRNEGIRAYNAATASWEFYEFDKFGGVTKGEVYAIGKSIYYEYPYGEYLLLDSWEYVSDDEYKYTVSSLENGEIKQQFHQGVFKRKVE